MRYGSKERRRRKNKIIHVEQIKSLLLVGLHHGANSRTNHLCSVLVLEFVAVVISERSLISICPQRTGYFRLSKCIEMLPTDILIH